MTWRAPYARPLLVQVCWQVVMHVVCYKSLLQVCWQVVCHKYVGKSYAFRNSQHFGLVVTSGVFHARHPWLSDALSFGSKYDLLTCLVIVILLLIIILIIITVVILIVIMVSIIVILIVTVSNSNNNVIIIIIIIIIMYYRYDHHVCFYGCRRSRPGRN